MLSITDSVSGKIRKYATNDDELINSLFVEGGTLTPLFKQEKRKGKKMKLIKLCQMTNYEQECLFYNYGISVYGDSIKEEDLKTIYLDWLKFFNLERFASYNSISEKLANKIITQGRKIFA